MKNKLHNKFQIFNYFASSDRYKAVFLLTVILALYGSIALGSGQSNLIDSNFITFMFPIFNIFMFAILFLNTLNICIMFNNSFSFYIIRLENKKKYIKELLKNVLLFNLMHLIIFFLLYFIVLFLLNSPIFTIHNYQNYDISNLLYLVFYLGRYVIISLIICLISTLLYVNFKLKAVFLLDISFITSFLLIMTKDQIVSSIFIFPWEYFTNIRFDNFSLEISSSILYILVLEIIMYVLYNFSLKNKNLVIS